MGNMYNGVELAPRPKKGNQMKVYDALVGGRLTNHKIKLATGLTGQDFVSAISNAARWGYVVRDQRFYAIAPRSTYDAIRAQASQQAKSREQQTTPREPPLRLSKLAKAMVLRSADREGLSADDYVVRAVKYRNANLNKRKKVGGLTFIAPPAQSPWWKFWA